MIGCDNVDRSREQLRPQSILLDGVAQRRRAFRDSTQPLHIIFGKEQIVRAGLDGNIGSMRAGLGSQRHSASGADVNNMQFRAGLTSEQSSALDGFEFCDHGPGGKKRLDATAIPLRQFLTFGVHCDRQDRAARLRVVHRTASDRRRAETQAIRNRTETP